MEKSEVSQRVKKAIAAVLKIDTDRIEDAAAFVADLGADSMQSVELVAAFEEEFEIEMDEDEALSVQTVDDAVSFIARIVNG